MLGGLFDLIGSVFKHAYWLVIIVVLMILGAVDHGCSSLGFSRANYKVHRLIDKGDTQKLSDYFHDYFIDHYNAHPDGVDNKMGALAEDAIRYCVEHGDEQNAKRIYREYEHGLSKYATEEFKDLAHDESKTTEPKVTPAPESMQVTKHKSAKRKSSKKRRRKK